MLNYLLEIIMLNCYKFLFVIVLIGFFSTPGKILAQDLKGKVYGVDAEGKVEVLPRATLQWLGTNTGTISATDGSFSLQRHSREKRLIVSFTGYRKDTILINDDMQSINVTLESELYLKGVDVLGEKRAQSVSRTEIVKTEIVSSRGLQKAACCNLSESFITNPSIDVNYSDAVSGAKQIEMLGLDGIYSQMMTEKFPLMRGLAAPYGLGYIPGTWMRQIAISKGAASVTDGYEAITGQICVDYKTAHESETVFLNGFADQFGRYEGNFNGKYSFSEHTNTIFFAHGSTMQMKMDENGDNFLNHPLLNTINLMNKWEIEHEQSHHVIGIKALYEDRKGGQKNYYPKRQNDLYGIGIETERYEAFAKNGYVFDSDTYNSIALILSGSYHNQKSFYGRNNYDGKETNLYANFLYETRFGSHDDHSDCHHEGGDDEHHSDQHSQTSHSGEVEYLHNLKLGLSYLFDDVNQSFRDIVLDRKERVPGVFAEYSYYGIEDLILVGGFRADFHNQYETFLTPRFFAKYSFSPFLSMRASVGKGYRVANIFSENTGVLASSREIFIRETLNPEEAWNYGINFSYDFFLAAMPFTINAELYRTDFTNQIIVDLEKNSSEAHFYNLDGKSYSNSFQVDINFEPINRLEITTAYRLSDVHSTIDSELLRVPLQSPHKAFMNFAYSTGESQWTFDLTVQYNSKGRLPNTSGNPVQYQLGDEFPAYFLLHSQISKSFGFIELYLGAENLTDYIQENLIIAYDDPFGKYFDAGMVWGPLSGRKVYLGFRYNLK